MSLARTALHPHTPDDLAAMVRESSDGLRIRGAGHWMHVGQPVRAGHEVHLDAFSGIRSYTPDDLTITVGAAMTLAELDAAVRAHGQWCPLLPWGDDAGTVGATLATASAGPFAAALGRPRDLALGLECVDGRGRVIRAGGRVVKNVAGFDLTRLMVGAWGTLGVITEVHLRLRARPGAGATYYIEGHEAVALRAFAQSSPSVLAALPLGEVGTRALRQEGHGAWLLRLAGNAAALRDAEARLARLGACKELDASAWDTVRRELAPAPHTTHWKWTPLAQRIKSLFDPRNQLNPGLLGDAQEAAA
jgi:glycolate oxidase FAD binding subunit